jgi:hypothetical protein
MMAKTRIIYDLRASWHYFYLPVRAGVQVASYSHLLYVLPANMAPICRWAGIAELPGTQSWYTPDSQVICFI